MVWVGTPWLVGVSDLRCDTSEADVVIPFLFLIISLIHFADRPNGWARPTEGSVALCSFHFLSIGSSDGIHEI